MFTRTTLLLALLSIGTMGCEPQELDSCLRPGDCGSKLMCVKSRCLSQKAANDGCKNLDQYTKDCKKRGECTWKEGKCVVGGPEDCKTSEGCAADATCSYNGKDKCVIGSDADCKQSEFCSKLKRCKHDKATQSCVPGSDAECKEQTDCKAAAACTFDKATSKCVPSAADCKASVMCINLGLCALDKGKCVPGSEEDCKKTVDCKAGKVCGWDEDAKKCVKEE